MVAPSAISEYFLADGDTVVATCYHYKSHTAEVKLILDKEQSEQAKASKETLI